MSHCITQCELNIDKSATSTEHCTKRAKVKEDEIINYILSKEDPVKNLVTPMYILHIGELQIEILGSGNPGSFHAT